MSEPWNISLVWWITAIELPVLGCMFWMIHHGRRESERALLRIHRDIQHNLNTVLQNVARSTVEVARLYATVADLKDVEKRLTDHLLRLEESLRYAMHADRRPGARWLYPDEHDLDVAEQDEIDAA